MFEVIPQSIWDAKVVIRSALVAQAFNTQGKPVTPFFQVSSIPYDDCVSRDVHPRIALRHNLAAVAWQDRNTNLGETDQLGLRVFRVKF